MDDKQLNKLNMFIKTADFYRDHSADLISVTQLAGLKTELSDLIDQIVDADGDADSDTSGFTIQKSDERTNVEGLTLKVSRALAAYGLSIGKPGLVRLADYNPSELGSKRDNDLYVKSKKLWERADPVKALLSGFNSGPTDVNNLDIALQEYFAVLQLPEEKRGEKKASGLEVDTLFKDADDVVQQMDIYMQTFEAVNSLLYNTYLSARAIDDNGGGSQSIKIGTAGINAVAHVPFADGRIAGDSVVRLVNNNTMGDLIFYFSDSETGGTGSATSTVTLGFDTTEDIVAGSSGFDVAHHHLNVFNPNAFVGKWKVEIL